MSTFTVQQNHHGSFKKQNKQQTMAENHWSGKVPGHVCFKNSLGDFNVQLGLTTTLVEGRLN